MPKKATNDNLILIQKTLLSNGMENYQNESGAIKPKPEITNSCH